MTNYWHGPGLETRGCSAKSTGGPSKGCVQCVQRIFNLFHVPHILSNRYSRTVEPHTSSSWALVADKIALTRGVTKCEWHQTYASVCVIFTGAFLVFCSGQTDLSGLHSGFFAWSHSHSVTPLVSAILSATRAHELDVCGSTVSEYREKGRSCVRIFFQCLNDIWNPRKISEGLLTCLITLVKFIWRSDPFNWMYCASSEGHRDFLSRL